MDWDGMVFFSSVFRTLFLRPHRNSNIVAGIEGDL